MTRDERELLEAAQDEAFERLFGQLREASAGEADSARKLAAAVEATLAFASERPEEARLLLIDLVGGEPELALRILGYHQQLASFMRSECEGRGRHQLPEVTEQALVGAAASLIGAHVATGRGDQLADLEAELVDFLLLPYAGRRAG